MLRTLPIDTSQMTLISTGKAAPRPVWVERSDGSRRPDPNGAQEKDESGTPMWTVDVLLDDDDADRSETLGIVVPSVTKPELPKWRPVQFSGLTASVRVDRNGKLAMYFAAAGITANSTGGNSRSTSKAASEEAA